MITVPVTEIVLRNRVRTIRTALGVSQEELAQRAHVSPTTVNKIETRAGYVPSRAVMERMATALHSHIGWVFYYEVVSVDASKQEVGA